jgi:hypothetical protein
MSKQNVEKLKKKIAALLAKAGGTDNEHEAASFAAKAQQMLEEHQLEIGDVVKTDAIDQSVVFVAPFTNRKWHDLIPPIMAEYYGCKVFRQKQPGMTAYLAVGRESSRITLALMLPFVVDQLRHQAAEYRKRTYFSMKKSMEDVCDAFYFRIRRLIDAQEQLATATGGHSRALVHVDEAQAWMNENKTGLTSKNIKVGETELAKEFADKINLARHLEGEKDDKLALTHG